MKPIVIALALMLLPTPAAAEPVRSLAQLPPIVQEHIRDMERGCGTDATPDYRLSEIVHVHPLSGPRTRDYIVEREGFAAAVPAASHTTAFAARLAAAGSPSTCSAAVNGHASARHARTSPLAGTRSAGPARKPCW